MEKRALQLASVASMIDLFNSDNISILRSQGYKVDVAANFKEGSITSNERVQEYLEELKEQNIEAIHVPIPRSIKKIVSIVKSYSIIKKLVATNHYHIVHCHSPIGGVICRLACINARKKGTKVIYTAHGFHFYKGASKVAWLLYYPIEKLCSRHTDILITINKEDYSRALRRFKACRVEFVPGIGIHSDKFLNVLVDREKKRKQLGFSGNDYIFMSTGQLSVRKNHVLVIKALAKIENPTVKYLIVGIGEEEEKLKVLVKRLQLDNRVVFAGYRSDIEELLHIVDAFVFPSLQEGLPVALMEAMAAGLPVVCSKIRGNTDLIKDGRGGYLCGCNDIDGFANRMRELSISNNTAMKQSNLCDIQYYDIKNVNNRMTDIYRSCLLNADATP